MHMSRQLVQVELEDVATRHNVDPIVITDDVKAWLAFLADARLMLGTRLDVSEDDDLVPRGDPEFDLYLYLGYLQQSLVEELLGHRA